MPAKPLEASVRYRPAGAVIDLRGELSSVAEESLNSAYAEAESKSPAAILLNFSGVSYINSAGIALIMGLVAKARARASKERMLACGLSDHYVEIFNITRLSDFMNIFPDEESALGEAATG